MTPLLLAALLTVVESPETTVKSILGLQIGMPVAEAREMLRPLGQSDAKELAGGTKEVWKLDRTGFEWIAIRSDADGRIVWITGHRRAGREIPFDDIGVAPGVSTESIAIWHVAGTHSGERLTLRGARRRAQVVSLSATRSMRQRRPSPASSRARWQRRRRAL